MSRLAEAIALLDASVTAFLSGRAPDSTGILQTVFAVNNEIGLLLRPSGDPALRKLQLMVNDVTVAAKAADWKKLQESVEKLRRASSDI